MARLTSPSCCSSATDLQAIRKLLGRNSDEERVTDAFRTWLISEGWTPVEPTDRFIDIEATRGGERLIGGVKGTTSEPGIDADTAYGQLLRRMTDVSTGIRYALIIPTASVRVAQRVPAHVRNQLRICLFEVIADGQVRQFDRGVGPEPPTTIEMPGPHDCIRRPPIVSIIGAARQWFRPPGVPV
ncbi:hypothetical protein [Micromonospora fulviviridis]|uniref:Restriction endonuclease type IV Mrr domain-containing protein n=1 Tax=Micromonospora fulviviridis TaxID=47860 RepID=A0ABV2VTS5_9ACTN